VTITLRLPQIGNGPSRAYCEALERSQQLRAHPERLIWALGMDARFDGVCDHCRTRTRCHLVNRAVLCRPCANDLIHAGRLDMPYIPAVASKRPEALIEGARHPVTMLAVARLRGVAVGTRMAPGTPEDGTEAPVSRQGDGRLIFDGEEVVEVVDLAEDVALVTEAGAMVLMDSTLYGALSRC
jgi:hypothetical protein